MPGGTNRTEAYNAMLPQLQRLLDGLCNFAQRNGATAANIATAWAMAKGATPIIGVTKPHHVEGLIRTAALALSNHEMVELEALAQSAGVNTRGWWEKDL